MSGFVAKEVVGNEQDTDSESLQRKIANLFTALAGPAFMAFMLLYTPCIVAVAIYQGGKALGFQ
ncbi:MAG: hypothetical protein ACOC41_00500 [Chitinivibrionales bacterium]